MASIAHSPWLDPALTGSTPAELVFAIVFGVVMLGIIVWMFVAVARCNSLWLLYALCAASAAVALMMVFGALVMSWLQPVQCGC